MNDFCLMQITDAAQYFMSDKTAFYLGDCVTRVLHFFKRLKRAQLQQQVQIVFVGKVRNVLRDVVVCDMTLNVDFGTVTSEQIFRV